MSNRVTEKMLNAKLHHLNSELGRPLTPYTRDADGKLRGNVGHFHLDNAYGGWQIVEMTNEAGGVRDVLHYRGSKREIADRIDALTQGVLIERGLR